MNRVLEAVLTNRLVVFDMDGTLLPGSTACRELARHAGALPELLELEARFAADALSTAAFADALTQLWFPFNSEIVRRAFEGARKLDNIAQVTKTIRVAGGISCLITMSPNLFAEQFYDFGFDLIYSSTFTLLEQGRLRADRILCPDDKPLLVETMCEERGIAMPDCVAFGDSMSDYPLFRALTHTVAVNADNRLSDLARLSYRGSDLFEALLLVCAQIQSPSETSTGATTASDTRTKRVLEYDQQERPERATTTGFGA